MRDYDARVVCEELARTPVGKRAKDALGPAGQRAQPTLLRRGCHVRLTATLNGPVCNMFCLATSALAGRRASLLMTPDMA